MKRAKKRILSVILTFAMVAAMIPASVCISYGSSSWDGKSIDVSWFSPGSSTYHISTGAQLAGLAALVNGTYNEGCTVTAGDASYIAANKEAAGNGGNNESTNSYTYGLYNFEGKTVYLDADIDMTAGNYMPIGGQYLMTRNDTSTRIDSSFCGTFDGQGYTVSISCDRYCSGNYGDGSSVALIGRLGVHDNDSNRPSSAVVRNVTVRGSVNANRSVGGVVGKVGRTSSGAVIENCVNYASVSSTDSNGCGGIAGSAWNGGSITSCYNAGRISTSGMSTAGGIAGSNEMTITNCYNVGTITASDSNRAMGIGSDNKGRYTVTNCYWLEGSASGGGYYVTGQEADGAIMKTSEEMKSNEFVSILGGMFQKDSAGSNSGYPVLRASGGAFSGGVGTYVPVEEKFDGKVELSTDDILGDTIIDKLITYAEQNKRDIEISVKAETGKSLEKIRLKMLKSSLKEISASKADRLVLKTDMCDISFDKEATADIISKAIGSDIVIEINFAGKAGDDGIISAALTVTSGNMEIREIGGKISISKILPENTEGQSLCIAEVKDDGEVKINGGVTVGGDKTKTAEFEIKPQATYTLISQETAESILKAYRTGVAKALAGEIYISTSAKKISKGKIRITAKADLSDIKKAGYTVKYKYYRSVKKSSGYKLIKTSSSNTYKYSGAKKGKRYYYKVKVYVYDNGKTAAKTVLQQSGAASARR